MGSIRAMTCTAHVDELPDTGLEGARWRPIRRTFGITGFSANGYTANAGEEVIERHDELSKGAGHHEELYLVQRGRARFEVGEEVIDAPVGTLVFVPPGVVRFAEAVENDTTVVVVGGVPGAALPVSPFEYWYAAEGPSRAGNQDEAIAIASEGLTDWPDNPGLHYQLACFHTLAGHLDAGLEHMRIAVASDPAVLTWSADDSDLDPIRDLPGFPSAST